MHAPLKHVSRLILAAGMALIFALYGAAPPAHAGCTIMGVGTCDASAWNVPDWIPYQYGQLVSPTVPVYATPWDEAAGLPPIRQLTQGFVWVSLADPQPLFEAFQLWYQLNPDGYVHAEQVSFFQPSEFQGTALAQPPDKPIAFTINTVRVSSAPGVAPVANAPRVARYALVTVFEERKMGDWTWYRIGDQQWLEQRQLGVVKASPRPAGVGANDKWIEVNLYEQTLAAYEGDRMVYTTLVSSGLPKWPTPTGLFQVWAKVTEGKMSGREGFPDYYFLADVPWALYFSGPVALHGAYWHDRFGAPHSHGCVNLSPKDAKWLFGWATPQQGPGTWTLAKPDNSGTWVWVH